MRSVLLNILLAAHRSFEKVRRFVDIIIQPVA